jgi:hypothetical protein
MSEVDLHFTVCTEKLITVDMLSGEVKLAWETM